MNPDMVPVITFVGLSGTGKTTFLEKLIPELKRRGLRLAVLKHDVHHFEMDKPGKDTYRFTAAGADVVAISGREQFAMIETPESELTLREILTRLPEVDLVLTEGYKRNSYPKIEIHRAALGRPLLSSPEELLAVMTDESLDLSVPQLSLEDVSGCADRIEAHLSRFSPQPDKALLVSACLLGVPCKYSSGDNLCPGVLALRDRYQLIPVCPEQLGGLPTPRPPAECRGDRVINREGADVTAQFQAGAEAALALAEIFHCTGAVLKSRSPSCGSGAIYDGSFTGTCVPGSGVTARLLQSHGIPVWTEESMEKIP